MSAFARAYDLFVVREREREHVSGSVLWSCSLSATLRSLLRRTAQCCAAHLWKLNTGQRILIVSPSTGCIDARKRCSCVLSLSLFRSLTHAQLAGTQSNSHKSAQEERQSRKWRYCARVSTLARASLCVSWCAKLRIGAIVMSSANDFIGRARAD